MSAHMEDSSSGSHVSVENPKAACWHQFIDELKSMGITFEDLHPKSNFEAILRDMKLTPIQQGIVLKMIEERLGGTTLTGGQSGSVNCTFGCECKVTRTELMKSIENGGYGLSLNDLCPAIACQHPASSHRHGGEQFDDIKKEIRLAMKEYLSPLSGVISGEYWTHADTDAANWFRRLVNEKVVTQTVFDAGDTIVGIADESLPFRAALRWKGLRASKATICQDSSKNVAWLLAQREPEWQHAVMHILTGAVGGQQSFQWHPEDHSQSAPREDFSATIPKDTRLVKVTTCELKKTISSSLLGNAEGFGQLVQYGSRDCGVGDYIGVLSSLNIFVFVRITFEAIGRVSSLQIFPTLKEISNQKMMCMLRLSDHLNSIELQDLLPISIPDAFLFLVRLVDEVCRMQHIPLTQPRVWLASVGYSAEIEWQINNVSIVCHTPRSLILSADEPSSSSTAIGPPTKVILKIGSTQSLNGERAIHHAIDGKVNNIRQLIGTVRIVDGPIEHHGIVLKPYGAPLVQLVDVNRFLDIADKILCDLHKEGVFHRDVKPSNFLCIDATWYLNDFDLSANVNSADNVGFMKGTPRFSSPHLSHTHTYDANDDKISLVFTIVELFNSSWMKGLADNPYRKIELLGELASDYSPFKVTEALSNYVRRLGVTPTRMRSPSTVGGGIGTSVSSTHVDVGVGVSDAPTK